ncbi:MAG: restriction endonuclease subunit S [Planctomycetia bacterium]|nr:restriction endonuclease subunit S [Planctomycetia bacterium]
MSKTIEKWKDEVFGDVFIFLQTNSFSRNDMNYDDGYVQNIHYGDIHTKYGCLLDSCTFPVPFLNPDISILKFKDGSYLQKGDIIIADTAEDNSVGKALEIVNMVFPTLSGQHTIACRPKTHFATGFLGYFLNSDYFHNQLLPVITGTKVSSISKANIVLTRLLIPPLPEQEKIAEILTTCDRVLTLKRELLEEKRKQKQWLMQNLLAPDSGVRLLGFNGEWESTHLSKVSQICKGTQINLDKLTKSGPYYVLNGGCTPSGYTNDWNVDEDTVSISEGGNSCGFVNYNIAKFWSGGHCYTLQNLHNNIHRYFLYSYLKYKEGEIMHLRVGSGLPNIQKKDLSIFLISYPPLPEQTAIAEILSTADKEISLLEEEIQAWELKKKALMQLLLTGIVRTI